MDNEKNCPFSGTAHAGRSNRDWWPSQLNLGALHTNHPAGDPMGDDRYSSDYVNAQRNKRGIALDLKRPEGVAGLKEFAPDLLVVAAYGQILSKDVLTVPPRGGTNGCGRGSSVSPVPRFPAPARVLRRPRNSC